MGEILERNWWENLQLPEIMSLNNFYVRDCIKVLSQVLRERAIPIDDDLFNLHLSYLNFKDIVGESERVDCRGLSNLRDSLTRQYVQNVDQNICRNWTLYLKKFLHHSFLNLFGFEDDDDDNNFDDNDDDDDDDDKKGGDNFEDDDDDNSFDDNDHDDDDNDGNGNDGNGNGNNGVNINNANAGNPINPEITSKTGCKKFAFKILNYLLKAGYREDENADLLHRPILMGIINANLSQQQRESFTTWWQNHYGKFFLRPGRLLDHVRIGNIDQNPNVNIDNIEWKLEWLLSQNSTNENANTLKNELFRCMIYITLCMEEMNVVKLYNVFPMKTSNIPMHMELSMTTINNIFPQQPTANDNPIQCLNRDLNIVGIDDNFLSEIYANLNTGQCFHRMKFNHSHPNMKKNGYKIHGMTTNGVELSIRFVSNGHPINPRVQCQNQVQCNLAYIGHQNEWNRDQNEQTIQGLSPAEKVENGLWKGRNKGHDSLYYEGIIPPPDERIDDGLDVLNQRIEERMHFHDDIGRGRPIYGIDPGRYNTIMISGIDVRNKNTPILRPKVAKLSRRKRKKQKKGRLKRKRQKNRRRIQVENLRQIEIKSRNNFPYDEQFRPKHPNDSYFIKSMKYSMKQRQTECSIVKNRKQYKVVKNDNMGTINCLRNNQTRSVEELEAFYSNCEGNIKSLRFSSFIPKLWWKAVLRKKTLTCYQNSIWRNCRFRTYCATLASEEKLVEDIKTFTNWHQFQGLDQKPILAYGDWDHKGNFTRGIAPSPGKRIRKLLARHFPIIMVNEFRTSKLCGVANCHQPLVKHRITNHQNGQQQVLWRVKKCNQCQFYSGDPQSNQNNNAPFFVNRDISAALNIRYIALHQIRSQFGYKPPAFTRRRRANP